MSRTRGMVVEQEIRREVRRMLELLRLRSASQLEASEVAPATHTHAQADVTGLVAALAGKAASVHTHAIADTTGLQAALDGKAAAAAGVPAGGTTGQVLKKTSNTDHDLTWAADNTGGGGGGALSDGDYGDVTVSGGATVFTIDNDAVTYAKLQNVSATDKLLGRATAGAGDVEEIACTAAGRALLDDADAAAQRTTLGLGTAAVEAATAFATATHSHAIADTTGLQAALDGKAASSHSHAIADTTGLQAALDGKAASSHTHAIADTTGLQAALDGKAASSHTHAVGDITGFTAPWDQDVRKTANQDVVNSATLVDAADLSFAVLAGEVWKIEALLVYSGDVAAGDFKVDLFPTAGNLTGWVRHMGSDTTGDVVNAGGGTRYAAAATITAITAGTAAAHTTKRVLQLEAMFVFSADATFKLRFAQNAAGGGVTSARLYAGSRLRGKKLA